MKVNTPTQYCEEYCVTFYPPEGGIGIEVRKAGWGTTPAEALANAKAKVERDAEYKRLKEKKWVIK